MTVMKPGTPENHRRLTTTIMETFDSLPLRGGAKDRETQ